MVVWMPAAFASIGLFKKRTVKLYSYLIVSYLILGNSMHNALSKTGVMLFVAFIVIFVVYLAAAFVATELR
jgi:hypothetical protein